MTFYQTYVIEYNRVLAGIILESRQLNAATKDKTGFQVEAYINAEIAKVTDSVIPYKIETEDGNLVAYFSIIVSGVLASQYQLFVRQNFLSYQADINLFISNYISSSAWKQDILQGELI